MKRSPYSLGIAGAAVLGAMIAAGAVAIERDPPVEPIEGRSGRKAGARDRDRVPADIQAEKIKRAAEKRARKAKRWANASLEDLNREERA